MEQISIIPSPRSIRTKFLSSNMQKEDCDHLAKQVLSVIGRPKYFHSTKCTKVSDHSYRINIYTSQHCGAVSTTEVVASYFLTLDDDMNITDSEPPLKNEFYQVAIVQ